jgi:O-antigen ligase
MTDARLQVVPPPADGGTGGDSGEPDRQSPKRVPGTPALLAVAVLLTVAFAVSCLFNGFYDLDVWAPAALALLVVLVGLVLLGPLELTRPAMVTLLGLLGLLALSALSMTWAESTSRAWTEVNRLAFYTATFLIVASAVRSRRHAQVVVHVMAAGFAIVCLYVTAKLLFFDGPSLFVAFRLSEPMGYVNGEAGFFLMAFWVAIAVAETARPVTMRAAGLGFATLAASLMLLTQSRAVVPAMVVTGALLLALLPGRVQRGWALLLALGGALAASPWLLDPYAQRGKIAANLPTDGAVQSAGLAALLAALAAAVIWGLLSARRSRLADPSRRRLALAPLVAAPLLVLVLGWVQVGNPIDKLSREYDRFVALETTSSADSRFGSLSGTRYDLWRIALNQFADHPIKGLGAGNYGLTYFQERRTSEPVRQPHSLELQLLAELGLLGLLALGLVLGGVGWAVARVHGQAVDARDRYVLIAAIGTFSVWFVHTSIDWLHNLPGVTGIAIVSAAILTSVLPGARRGADVFDRGPRGRLLLLVGAVAAIAVAAASVGLQYVGERYRQQARDELATDPAAALTAANRALDMNPGDVNAHEVRAAALARFGDYEGARSALRDAAADEPHNYVPWVLLGDLAVRRGDIEQARADYGVASRLNPVDTALEAAAADPTTVLQDPAATSP